jgi:3',5'-cyclic AMP phosphodiesterase CpdA
LARPFLLAQLSDLHLDAEREAGAGPTASLETVLVALGRLPTAVDAVLVSGDLANGRKAAEYALARELLGRLGVPVHVLPGNNDDRAALREAFDLPGDGNEPIDYAVDLGPLRLVVIDSTIPGKTRGEFTPAQLERLGAELAAAPETPTIVATHHPPLTTAIAEWDRFNLRRKAREALAATIAPHPQVKAIVGGHLHRIAASTLAGRPVIVAPSTYLQARPDFVAETVDVDARPPGFVLHALLDGELSSQVELVPAAG